MDEDKRSPAEIEKAKTQKQRAADIAYTTNHALICTATDFIDPYVNNSIQKSLGNKSQIGNMWAAEIAGDFGAIPVTVAAQRFFPGMMAAIGKMVEPIFRKPFQNGAKRDAKEWAKRHGFEVGSQQYKDRADQYYKYEVDHLPQALMWTASSVVLNVGTQRALGNKAPVKHMVTGKVGGAILTAGITLGARIVFPRKAEKFDKFTSEHLFMPMEDKVDDMIGADKKDKDWSDRVQSKTGKEQSSPAIH